MIPNDAYIARLGETELAWWSYSLTEADFEPKSGKAHNEALVASST